MSLDFIVLFSLVFKLFDCLSESIYMYPTCNCKRYVQFIQIYEFYNLILIEKCLLLNKTDQSMKRIDLKKGVVGKTQDNCMRTMNFDILLCQKAESLLR